MCRDPPVTPYPSERKALYRHTPIRPTSNIERRTSNIERRTSNAQTRLLENPEHGVLHLVDQRAGHGDRSVAE
jgi:hypothetical protein